MIWIVRDEARGDIDAVRAVNLAAFPGPGEADLVDRVRGDADWLMSMVAEEEADDGLEARPTGRGSAPGRVVGHILVTRVRIDGIGDERLFGAIGPVAVLPAFQRKGIGSALCRRALEEARAMEIAAMFVLGDPGYYARFGFRRADALGLRCAWEGTEEAFGVVVIDAVAVPPHPPRGLGPLSLGGERGADNAEGTSSVMRMVRYHEAFSAFE